jgi:protein arginine kinase activator
MKCEFCGKKEADIIFTQIVGNEKTVTHLCGECATKKGITHLRNYSSQPKGDLKKILPSEEVKSEELCCPACGLSYSEFREEKLLGCGECYVAFYQKLMKLLKDVHGAESHLKSDAGESHKDISRTIAFLKESLKLAIEREAFEEATRIRDRIANLERRR